MISKGMSLYDFIKGLCQGPPLRLLDPNPTSFGLRLRLRTFAQAQFRSDV